MLEPVDIDDEEGGSTDTLPSDPSNSPQVCLDHISAREDDLLSELDGVLTATKANHNTPLDLGGDSSFNNGISPKHQTTSPNLDKIAQLYEKYSIQCNELERVEKQNGEYRDQLLNLFKERDSLQNQLKETTNLKAAKVQELERKLLESEYQLKATKDRLAAQENHFKKSHYDLSSRCTAQLEQLKRSTETAKKEKDEAVVKYAMRESEIINLTTARDKALEQLKQTTIERDALNSRLRGAKNEKTGFQHVLDEKISEIADLKKEVERVQSFISESDLKAKMAVKKMEEIENAHKETKIELDKTILRLKESREETETIRADCQKILRTYHESADKEKVDLEVQKQEHNDQEEIHKMVLSEMDAVKKQLKQCMEEYNSCKSQNEQLSQKNSQFKYELEVERSARAQDNETISRLEPLAEQTESALSRAVESERSESLAREEMRHAETESSECRLRVQHTLLLNQQLTDTNSQLQAECDNAKSKVVTLESENSCLTKKCEEMSEKLTSLESELSRIQECSSAEINSMKQQLSEKISCVQTLRTELEDEQNQNKVLRKKYAAGSKELKNELSTMKRRLDAFEAGTASAGSFGNDNESVNSVQGTQRSTTSSRASSQTSLDRAGRFVSAPESPNSTLHQNQNSNDQSSFDSQEGMKSEHQQAMIEKIVKLQRLLARRTEKIEFLEEHVRQLVEEVQKKSKIIQMYALREETGALAPESLDINKAELAKKGHTLMGSVFGQHADSKITAHLASEIVGKMQAVLEDTLLKNITLKESIETLGQEISRLSRENRTIHLKEREK